MAKSKIKAPIEELLEMYRSGLTLQQIGDKFNASREAVRKHFENAGVLVMNERALTRNTRNKKLKPLAEEVLIESCNRKVKEVWKKKRYAEALLRNIKKSRIDLINKIDKNLHEIQRVCDLGLTNKKQSLLALQSIKGIIASQIEDFEQYKNMMNSYNPKDYNIEI